MKVLENKKPSNSEPYEEYSFKELILKFLILNWDKITLVFIYVIAIKIVNLFHFSNLYLN